MHNCNLDTVLGLYYLKKEEKLAFNSCLSIYNVNLLVAGEVISIDYLVLLAVKSNRQHSSYKVNIDAVAKCRALVRQLSRDLLL